MDVAAGRAIAHVAAASEVAARRDALQRELQSVPDVVVFGGSAPRLPNTLCLAFDGVNAESLVMGLRDMVISSGSACSSTRQGVSPTLLAMGVSESIAAGAIRISIGHSTTDAELATVGQTIRSAVEAIRQLA